MIIFVDGDNNIKNGVKGTEKLNKEENQKKVKQQANCKVVFHPVKCSKNSVDFTIAIDASQLDENESVAFISTDEDFTTFCNILKKKFPKRKYFLGTSVLNAVQHRAEIEKRTTPRTKQIYRYFAHKLTGIILRVNPELTP